MVSKAVLVVSSFLATVALSIVIGAMAQLHTGLLRMVAFYLIRRFRVVLW